MTDKYILRVTAGPDYDIGKHVVVPVNSPDPVRISHGLMDAELNVRLENYRGLPRGAPATSPYFATEPHASNKDKYSMAIRFTPKKPGSSSSASASSSSSSSGSDSRRSKSATKTTTKPSSDDSDAQQKKNPAEKEEEEEDEEDDEEEGGEREEGISGLDLQFGNDFDHPIRDRLPPGFSYAMSIVKWWIDPGLEGDVYADAPHLYGPALSSFNTVHVGPGEHAPERGGLWFEEGGDEPGRRSREAAGAPRAAKERMKWALRRENKEKWVFGYGRAYCVDFFNPYLDFSDFSLRLPGFTLPIMKYWDGQPLRYVLRNRATEDTYLVILFTLHLREDVNEDGTLKREALEGLRQHGGKTVVEDVDVEGSGGEETEEQDYEEAKRRTGELAIGKDKIGDADDDGVD